MAFSLLPKEYEFFDMFDELAEHCTAASNHFHQMISKEIFSEDDIKKLKEIERTADSTVYNIVDRLNKTFITPIDREDIHALAHELDSVIDYILKVSNNMKIYKVTEINPKFREEAKLINRSVEALVKAVNGLRNMKDVKKVQRYCNEVNLLEDEGDQLRNEVIAELFGEHNDAIYIMKWKDIFQVAEKVLDQCDDVGKIVESILVKQA